MKVLSIYSEIPNDHMYEKIDKNEARMPEVNKVGG
jgi:hypothetical protein